MNGTRTKRMKVARGEGRVEEDPVKRMKREWVLPLELECWW